MPEPQAVPAATVGARRVLQIFQQHHLRPRALDGALSSELFERVLSGLGGEGECAGARQALRGEASGLVEALRAGDFAFARRAAEACGRALSPGQARARMLDAFARAQDPHSAFVDASELAVLRSEIHRPAAREARVRGRLVELAGVRLGVLRVPSFYLHPRRSTSSDARHLLGELAAQGVEAMVVDLRMNGGGVEAEALALFGVLAGPGVVGQRVGRDGQARVLRSVGPAAWDGPLVVVIDAMTASVAELVAGALQDTGRALVVGQQSHGKGTGQTLVLLSSPRGGREGAVRVTDRSYHRVDGTPLQQLGVTPDVVLPRVGAAVATERERAGALVVGAVAPVPTTSPASLPRADQPPWSAAVSLLSQPADVD